MTDVSRPPEYARTQLGMNKFQSKTKVNHHGRTSRPIEWAGVEDYSQRITQRHRTDGIRNHSHRGCHGLGGAGVLDMAVSFFVGWGSSPSPSRHITRGNITIHENRNAVRLFRFS